MQVVWYRLPWLPQSSRGNKGYVLITRLFETIRIGSPTPRTRERLDIPQTAPFFPPGQRPKRFTSPRGDGWLIAGRAMRFVRLVWIATRPGGAGLGFATSERNPSKKSGFGACIGSRTTTSIRVIMTIRSTVAALMSHSSLAHPAQAPGCDMPRGISGSAGS